MSRVLTFFCSLLIAVVLLPVQPGIAQVGVAAGEIEVLVNDSTVPRSDDPKHPNLAASGNVVHLAANPNDKVRYWAKTDSAGSWPSPATLGDAPEQSDYSTASVQTVRFMFPGLIEVVIGSICVEQLPAPGLANAGQWPERIILPCFHALA